MSAKPRVVIAIDPGRAKCGIAAARAGNPVQILLQAVVDTGSIAEVARDLAARYSPDAIIVGDGTNSSAVCETVTALDLASVETVDERHSTELARKRFFADNPPRGLRRLIPTSLQTPDRPCDDYVAVILAERYLEGRR